MKKIKILVLVSVLVMAVMLFSGCANKILYGSWQLEETINMDTNESQEPMFANMMVFTIQKDGTVLLMDSEFGTYEKDGSEFIFTYDTDEGEEPKYETGAWELIGTDLYIYDDSKPYTYHLVAVTRNNDQ